MAKPYKEGHGWTIRLRYKQQIYLSGFETESAARKAAAEKKRAIDQAVRPPGLGPWRTSFAQATPASALPPSRGQARTRRASTGNRFKLVAGI